MSAAFKREMMYCLMHSVRGRSLSLFAAHILWMLALPVSSQDIEAINEQKPVTFNGSLNVGLQMFEARGRPANREPFMWYIQGNPVLTVYGVTLPFSFSISEQQRDFRQPFNQFGVSPSYKWIKAHIGYTNVVFSPFTLGGHTIAGGGVELTPGKFRFGVMYGRLFRAVHAIGNPDGSFVTTPSFKRNAGSVKIGYGTETNFVDLVLVKGQDDKTSIDYVGSGTEITPAENLVVGIYSRQTFLKHFFFEGEYAESVFTRNVDLTEPDSTSYSLIVKPFSSLMQNQNASTTHNSAIDASLAYQRENYGLRVKYREIGPDYQSMGAYFFQNDLRNITVEPSIKLFKSALQVNGSYGYQTDNLDNRRASTTKRKIGSVNVNGRIGQTYTGNLFYSNYDLGQTPGTVSLDTLIQVSQTLRSWGMMQNLMLSGEKLIHNLTLNYNYQILTDRNPNTSAYADYNTDTWLGSYFLTLSHLKLSLTTSYTFTRFALATQHTQISGPTLGLTKTLLKNSMSLNITYSSMGYLVDDQRTRSITRLSMNTSYRVSRRHRFNLRFYLNQSSNEAEHVQSFREIKGDIQYALSF